MPFVVVYDANALYGNAQRDLLIRIAQSGLVQAKWTVVRVERVPASLLNARRTSCAVRSLNGTWPIHMWPAGASPHVTGQFCPPARQRLGGWLSRSQMGSDLWS